MFDFDKWQDIYSALRQNKLRAFLTMFGVFWGIFMLILLLGAGNGLRDGVTSGFSSWATNSGFVWTWKTQVPYKGLKPGRRIYFTNADTAAIKSEVAGLQDIAPRVQMGRGGRWSQAGGVSYGNKSGEYYTTGEDPAYFRINLLKVLSGRLLNDFDIQERRKVVAIGKEVRDVLFENEDPIGQYVKVQGVYFQVVGVFGSNRSGNDAERDNQTLYAPYTTFQQAFNYPNRVNYFAFSALPDQDVTVVEERIKKLMRLRHNVHPDDKLALRSRTIQEEFNKLMALFKGITIFCWVVGIGTLLAGLIGVSNIMLIMVKERTKEIGIRKSIGATPASIVMLILQESILIASVAGYTGLMMGTLVVEGIGAIMKKAGMGDGMFGFPSVDLHIATSALMVIILGGMLAGFIPARKAASISPVEAIRAE